MCKHSCSDICVTVLRSEAKGQELQIYNFPVDNQFNFEKHSYQILRNNSLSKLYSPHLIGDSFNNGNGKMCIILRDSIMLRPCDNIIL